MAYQDDDSFEHGGSPYGANRTEAGRDSTALVAKSEDEARRALEKNQKALANIEFKTDEEGNSKFFGMKVDKATMSTILPFIELGKVAILERGKDVYKFALELALRAKLKGESANTVAAVADTAFRWGIVGAEQISATFSASSDYADKRRDLYLFFNPIIEATGIKAGDNEVISLAYKRARNDYGDGLRTMINDLPRIAPTAFLGYQQQKIANEGYVKELSKVAHPSADPMEAYKKKMDEAAARMKERFDAEKQATEFISKHKKEFVDHQMKSIPRSERDAKPWLRSKLERDFDTDIAKGLREEFFPKTDPKNGDFKSKEDKEKSNNLFYFMSAGGSAVSQILKSSWSKKRDKSLEAAHVPEMVDHLRKEIANQCEGASKDGYGRCETEGKTADEIQVTGMGRDAGSVSLKAYILQMFQQHERDREPLVDWAKRDKTGHVIEVIDPLGPALVTKLEPSIDLIAEAVASGLDPAALINLIGGNKIIVHGKNGAKTFANEEKVRDAIDELMPLMSSHEVIKLEEYLGKFEKPEEIKNIIKGNLETLKGQERQLFAALFPDDILKELGMKHKEITEARKEAHAQIYDFVAANVLYLSNKNEEELKKLGLSEDEVTNLKGLADKINEGDERALKAAVDGHDKSLIDAVRTAGLLEQHHGSDGKQYWSDRTNEIKNARHKVKDAVKQAAGADEEKNPLEKMGYDGEKSAVERRMAAENNVDSKHAGGGYDDEDASPSFAGRVSKKSNSHSSRKYGKEGSSDSVSDGYNAINEDGDSMDSGYASAIGNKRNQLKLSDSVRPSSYTERVRSSSSDDERIIS